MEKLRPECCKTSWEGRSRKMGVWKEGGLIGTRPVGGGIGGLGGWWLDRGVWWPGLCKTGWEQQ